MLRDLFARGLRPWQATVADGHWRIKRPRLEPRFRMDKFRTILRRPINIGLCVLQMSVAKVSCEIRLLGLERDLCSPLRKIHRMSVKEGNRKHNAALFIAF